MRVRNTPWPEFPFSAPNPVEARLRGSGWITAFYEKVKKVKADVAAVLV
jgi:hypothetical protein